MDGQAELFFVYRFERLAVQEYQRGQEGPIIIEVYQVASPADAYGLFSFYVTGQPMDLGAGGAVEPGRLVSFWQGPFYARVFAYGEAEQESLSALARQVAAGMPEEGGLPELVTRLPQENLVPGSARFFHQKLSLDNLIWLGEENILNLSEQTDAVLAGPPTPLWRAAIWRTSRRLAKAPDTWWPSSRCQTRPSLASFSRRRCPILLIKCPSENPVEAAAMPVLNIAEGPPDCQAWEPAQLFLSVSYHYQRRTRRGSPPAS
jgi:hypothetical protein